MRYWWGFRAVLPDACYQRSLATTTYGYPRRRGLLELGEARDLAGGDGVARHYGGLLGQDDCEPPGFKLGAVKLPQVAPLAVRHHHPAVAEGVLAPGVEGEAGLHPPLQGAGQVRQRAVVVVMSVAHDQGIGHGRVDLEHLVVVREAP